MPKARPSSPDHRPAALWTQADPLLAGARTARNVIRADGLITPEQAAELCGVTTGTIYSWVCRQTLPVARREGPRKYLLNLADVVRADLRTRRISRRPLAAVPAWTVEGDASLDLGVILRACRAVAEQELAAAPPPSVVYYAQFGDRIKIGVTSQLRSRMGDIPHDRLLVTEPGGREVETRRHEQFAAYRLTGEWFRAAFPLMAHIAALQLAV